MSCPNCQKGEILPGETKGAILPDNSYFSAAPNPSEENRSHAIVILTDVFGLGIQNPKIIADLYAERLNVDVYVPDYFNGYYAIPAGALKFADRAGYTRSWAEWVKFVVAMIPLAPRFIANRPSVVQPRLTQWIQKLRADKGYKRIGGIGYCYGGQLVVHFARPGLFDSAVVAHPGRFPDEDMRAIASPISFICAEDDSLFPSRRQMAVETTLSARKGAGKAGREIEYEFVLHPGTAHGFAIRPVLAYPEIQRAFDAANDQAIAWFARTLPQNKA